jgi:two-component system, NarL family, nitrate/nitrite response regulator NarL
MRLRQFTPGHDEGRRDAAVIQVLLISDVRLHREGIAELLRRDGRVEIIGGEPRSANDISGPEVVLLDSSDPGAVSIARRFAGLGRPVVVLGVPADEAVLRFAEVGVIGFVERDSGVRRLVESIEAALRGEASCSPRIATLLLRRLTGLPGAGSPRTEYANLTARERQILRLIDTGLSNKEIAQQLRIEVATVKNHVHNILEKLQVRRRGEAAAQLRLIEGAASGAGELGARTRSR